MAHVIGSDHPHVVASVGLRNLRECEWWHEALRESVLQDELRVTPLLDYRTFL